MEEESAMLVESKIEYAVSLFDDAPPNIGWAEELPEKEDPNVIWFRTVYTYSDGSTMVSFPMPLEHPNVDPMKVHTVDAGDIQATSISEGAIIANTVLKVDVIPPDTKLAAKRGFIRTTAQAYATSFAGGISATTIIALVSQTEPWLPILITWIVAIITPILSGLASYLDILSKGVPSDYVNTEEIIVSNPQPDIKVSNT